MMSLWHLPDLISWFSSSQQFCSGLIDLLAHCLTPASGPIHLLFPLSEVLFSQTFTFFPSCMFPLDSPLAKWSYLSTLQKITITVSLCFISTLPYLLSLCVHSYLFIMSTVPNIILGPQWQTLFYSLLYSQ